MQAMRLAHGSHPGLLAAEAASWWGAERHADVHLVVAGGVALPAHRCLLAAASRLARRLLADLPPHAAPITVHLPEVGATEARLLLQLLYTGTATVQVSMECPGRRCFQLGTRLSPGLALWRAAAFIHPPSWRIRERSPGGGLRGAPCAAEREVLGTGRGGAACRGQGQPASSPSPGQTPSRD